MDSNRCNAGYMGSRTSDINISIRGTGKACITNESQDFGNMMSAMFWFVTYHFTIMPVILIIPVFLLLGWLIPAVLYHAGKRQSIVENLREL